MKTICHVTKITKCNSAFAIREDNGESVFIPRSVAKAAEIGYCDTIVAIIQRNRREGEAERNPWFCVAAEVLEDDY